MKKHTPLPFKEFLPKFLAYAAHKRSAAVERSRTKEVVVDVDVEIPEDDESTKRAAKDAGEDDEEEENV